MGLVSTAMLVSGMVETTEVRPQSSRTSIDKAGWLLGSCRGLYIQRKIGATSGTTQAWIFKRNAQEPSSQTYILAGTYILAIITPARDA